IALDPSMNTETASAQIPVWREPSTRRVTFIIFSGQSAANAARGFTKRNAAPMRARQDSAADFPRLAPLGRVEIRNQPGRGAQQTGVFFRRADKLHADRQTALAFEQRHGHRR